MSSAPAVLPAAAPGTAAKGGRRAPARDVAVPRSSERPRLRAPAADVTAVLVSHNGSAWLPEVLAALERQTRRPDRLVTSDTGSTDGCAELLEASSGVGAVVRAEPSTGFGAAVALALAAADALAPGSAPPGGGETHRFVWLLHDDCAPAPDALERLVVYAVDAPSAAVVGPKVVDWDDGRRLVEVGLTTDGAGRRHTGLDADELDQGQHDAVRDVLAVGTAGMLVRRDAWDLLRGLDPALPLLGDDVDLGWRAARAGMRVVVVPSARVRHVRATVTGRRPAAMLRRPRLADRRHAAYLTAANRSVAALPWLLPRLVLGALARSVGLLLTRRPRAAVSEVAGVLAVLLTPWRLWRGRRWRAPARTRPARQARHLLAPRAARSRRVVLATAGRLAGRRPDVTADDPLAALETGPRTADDVLPVAPPSLLHRALRTPDVLLAAVLAAVAAVAARGVLGAGALTGPGLRPVPAGARDLWAAYAAGWHAGGLGSPAPSPPWTPVLAGLSTLLGGKPWLAVEVLVLGAVPLAGLSASVALRPLGLPVRVRVWAAAAYALLPVVTGAVAGGRLDLTVAAVAVPLLLAGGARLLSAPRPWAALPSAVRVGVGLAAAASFCPPLLTVAAGLLAATVLLSTVLPRPRTGLRRLPPRLLAAAVVVAVPVGLALPTARLLRHDPSPLLTGWAWGTTAVPSGPLGSARLLLLAGPARHPVLPPVWVVVPLVVAAGAALLRRDRHRVTLPAWGVALLALGGALAASRLRADGRPVEVEPALTVAGAALVAAAAAGSAGMYGRLRRSSFGLRQPAALVLAAAAVAVPVSAAGVLVERGLHGPLQRQSAPPLPPLVTAQARPGDRVLLLSGGGSGGVTASLQPLEDTSSLHRLDGSVSQQRLVPQLGDDVLVPPAPARRALAAFLPQLVGGGGGDVADTAASLGIRDVVLRPPVTVALVDDLGRQPRLDPVAAAPGVLWQVGRPVGRLAVLSPAAGARAQAGDGPGTVGQPGPPVLLPAGPQGAATAVPAGRAGRLLVLTDPADRGWQARLDGRSLPAVTAYGWAQAFVLPAVGPAGADRLTLRYDQAPRHRDLTVQVGLLALLLVLGAPTVRRRGEVV